MHKSSEDTNPLNINVFALVRGSMMQIMGRSSTVSSYVVIKFCASLLVLVLVLLVLVLVVLVAVLVSSLPTSIIPLPKCERRSNHTLNHFVRPSIPFISKYQY